MYRSATPRPSKPRHRGERLVTSPAPYGGPCLAGPRTGPSESPEPSTPHLEPPIQVSPPPIRRPLPIHGRRDIYLHSPPHCHEPARVHPGFNLPQGDHSRHPPHHHNNSQGAQAAENRLPGPSGITGLSLEDWRREVHGNRTTLPPPSSLVRPLRLSGYNNGVGTGGYSSGMIQSQVTCCLLIL